MGQYVLTVKSFPRPKTRLYHEHSAFAQLQTVLGSLDEGGEHYGSQELTAKDYHPRD